MSVYKTKFYGEYKFSDNATPYLLTYLSKFFRTIHIERDVLTEKGYCFDYVSEHAHINPFDSSSGWLEKNYPDITEHYVIENQPELK